MDTDYMAAADWPLKYAACRPLPLTAVQLDGFLGLKTAANLDSLLIGWQSLLPARFRACAAGTAPPEGTERLAADSDAYKWLEGASYANISYNNACLRAAMDELAGHIIACQHDDGYINTQVPPQLRFDANVNHDLYIAGHFFEAASAFYRSTGDDRMVMAAARWADYLYKEYRAGNPYFNNVGVREHPECELGLLRLYRITGDRRHLELALFLARASKVGPVITECHAGGGNGLHAVRLAYLLAGRLDLYLETGMDDLVAYLPELWAEMTGTRMYITGGLGCLERIPEQPFSLPQWYEYHPSRDVAETCASVALMMFSWRLHALQRDTRWFDVIEVALYNHILGALSLDGCGIFYYNPLRVTASQSTKTEHDGSRCQRTRLPKLHSCTCCMPNAWRLLGALPEYVFSGDEDGLDINLYTSSRLTCRIHKRKVVIELETAYPQNGTVAVRVHVESPTPFHLRLRKPGWCNDLTVALNGNVMEPLVKNGYVDIDRVWQAGDEVAIELSMPVRMLFSDTRILDNTGQVAFACGPLIYCLEQEDADFPLERLRVGLRPGDVDRSVMQEWQPALLGGMNVLRLPAFAAPESPEPGIPYFTAPTGGIETSIALVPYYARANRQCTGWTTFLPMTSGI